jgi:hypothetical protein
MDYDPWFTWSFRSSSFGCLLNHNCMSVMIILNLWHVAVLNLFD